MGFQRAGLSWARAGGRRHREARRASRREWRSRERAPGGSGQAACCRACGAGSGLSSAGQARGWASWARRPPGLQTSTVGMLEARPSGIEGEKFCPSPAAFQGLRPGPAAGGPGGSHAAGLAWARSASGVRPRRLAGPPRSGRFSPARALGPWFPPGSRGGASGRGPATPPRRGPGLSRRPPAASAARALLAQPGRTAGAWGRGPRSAGSPQLLAPPKMTICHSIKVSGQLMEEPGSATPGQNGLLPRIGEVQMLNAEHCVLSQAGPPPRPQVRPVDSSGVKGSGH